MLESITHLPILFNDCRVFEIANETANLLKAGAKLPRPLLHLSKRIQIKIFIKKIYIHMECNLKIKRFLLLCILLHLFNFS